MQQCPHGGLRIVQHERQAAVEQAAQDVLPCRTEALREQDMRGVTVQQANCAQRFRHDGEHAAGIGQRIEQVERSSAFSMRSLLRAGRRGAAALSPERSKRLMNS